jgi:hypothetical protein
MSSILLAIQEELANKARNDPFFSSITVLTESMKDISYLVELAMAKARRAVVVTTPRADVRYPDRLTPYFDDIRVVGFCFENVAINRVTSGYIASIEIAENLLSTWYQYKPLGINEVWTPEVPSIALGSDLDHPLVQLVQDTFFLAYAVRFKTSGGIYNAPPQCAAVTMTETVVVLTQIATVTLACATGGAAIFYTIDGDYPNTLETLYTAPFACPVGTQVIAKAYLAGYLDSALLKTTV